jgi:O-antigen/teichoic acid export membrane protein
MPVPGNGAEQEDTPSFLSNWTLFNEGSTPPLFGLGQRKAEKSSLLEPMQQMNREALLQETPTMPLKALEPITDPLPSHQLARMPDRAGFVPVAPEFDKFDTVPMMVLKGIATKQGELPLVMKSEISGAASNAAIIGLGNIVGYILKYANNLVIQRGLGPGVFGLYSIGMSVATLIASIFDLGLDNAMIRYLPIYRQKKQSALIRGLSFFCSLASLLGGLFGGLLLLFFAPWLAQLVHKPVMTSVFQLMAPLVPILCIQTIWVGGLQGFKEFKKRVLLQRLIVPIMIFLMMTGALLLFKGMVGFILVTIVSTVISTFLNLYYLYKAIVKVSRTADRAYQVREWLRFSIPNLLTSIINTVLDAVDTLLLAFYVSPVAAGLYTAANKISGFIGMPLTSLNVMFSPTIAELYSKGEKQKLEEMLKIVTKWSITFSLPIFSIATLFSVPLLGLSSNGFADAWPLLIVLAVRNMVSAATGPVGYVLLMTKYQRFSLFNSVIGVAINVIVGVLLTPRYGAMGTAVSTSLAVALVNLMRLVEVNILLKMQLYRWDTLKPIIAGILSSLFTGFLLYLLGFRDDETRLFHMHLSLQFALIPVFLAAYISLLILFKVSPEDQVIIEKLSKKLRIGKGK